MPRHAFPIVLVLLAASGACWLAARAVSDDGSLRERTDAADGSPAEPSHPKVAGVVLSVGSVPASALKAPDGFEVTAYAGDDLVHDAYCLTVDPAGRVVVSGPGYIRRLIDRNGDGRADEAVPFADGPKSGAQGLCFDGDDLLAVGDGGLLRYRDANRDGRADGPPVTLMKLKTGGEHHAHAIRCGPDGWWYLICGNDTGVTAATITSATSPVARPEAGVLLRFRYDSSSNKPSEIQVVADGLRNAYDFDFTADGDPVTYDSDDEREVSLPWYRPTRVFRLTPGSHAGWHSRSWKRPDTYPEMPEVLARLGRGSPTGVVVYLHDRFPEPYRDAVFVCDWTFGRVVAIPMDEKGRPGKPIEFLMATGSAGFAPTDIEVGPDGCLYVSAGGRGTTGTVYRARYVADAAAGKRSPTVDAADEIDRKTPSPSKQRREELESLAEMSPIPASKLDIILPALSDRDPNIRKAAMHVVSRLPEGTLAELAPRAAASPATNVRFHLGRLRRNDQVDLDGLKVAVATLERPGLGIDVRCDAVRLAQLALGDVGPTPKTPDTFCGYVARADLSEWRDRLEPLTPRLVALFPTGVKAVDDEFVRLLAMLRPADSGVADRLLDRIKPVTHPTDDLHHLFAVARLPAARSVRRTDLVAEALVAIDAKLAARGLRIDSYWGDRLGDLVEALVASDPALAAALVRHPDFGRPGHAILLDILPDRLRDEAAAAFVLAADTDPDYRWTPEAVRLLGEAGDATYRDRLRSLVEKPAVRGVALSILAERPDEADRSRYVAGLGEPQVEVVECCVAALEDLAPSTRPAELAALAETLRRLGRDEREYAVRDRIAGLLHRSVGKDFGFVRGEEGYRPQPEAVARWTEYVRSVAPEFVGVPGGDWETVRPLLAKAESLTGNLERGRSIYEARSCNRCHDGGSVGPDLAGVAGRFSREDLFRSIVDPDRDVSERYRGTAVQTTDGHVVTGLVVYESADGVMLKDGTKTWRVESAEIESRQPLDTSLMPRGLLKAATPQEIADLEAYLRSLGRQ